MKLRIIGVAALLALAPVVAAPARAQPPPLGVAGASAQSPPPEYRIQAGDELEIKFFYSPTLNEKVTVRPDGRISLQLIPEFVVADLTPAALTERLTQLYSKELRQPQVAVIVQGFASQRVYVDGEVGKPGMLPLQGVTTVLQAIAQAGGAKESARLDEVVVIRRGAPGKPIAFRLNLRKARSGADFAQDVELAPFDVIFVARSRVSNVNLWMDQYIRKNIPIPFGLQYGIYR
jgi:polysaccharide export outer membrane protein